MKRSLVAGADFGSDSVRVIIFDVFTGHMVAEAVSHYPRWKKGVYCDAAKSQFRQHPLDYIESFTECMKSVMGQISPNRKKDLQAIAIDSTGSTPCPVNENGTPLAMLEEFRENPNAMFHLWKDHTAVEEAKEINRVFSSGKIDYTRYQGIYSSEWYWAKILHTIRIDKEVKKAAWSWVEHCDWLPSFFIGKTDPLNMYRGSCAAGHKALYNSHFGGLPHEECLEKLDPYLAQIAKRYQSKPKPAGTRLGIITKEWADLLGIPDDTIIGGGSFDAHAGAVGAGVRPRTMVKVVGTSAVDMLVEDEINLEGKNLRAYCGQAEDSIVPGYIGIEASQAAFGDVFAWFSSLLMWPLHELLQQSQLIPDNIKTALTEEISLKLIGSIEKKAMLEDTELISLDWFNGRRYPHLNEQVKAAIMGLHLGTSAPQIYHALAMSTVFGSKRVFDSYISNGINVDRMILVGGIAKKSPFIMQMMADVLQRPVMVCREEQVCALGAAIYAAVAAGFFENVPAAQDALCEPYNVNYLPNKEKFEEYEKKYLKYLEYGDFIEDITLS